MDDLDEGIASNDSTPDVNGKLEVAAVSRLFKDLKHLNGQCVDTTEGGIKSPSLHQNDNIKGIASDKERVETLYSDLPNSESELDEMRSSPPSNDSATADLHLSKEAIDGEVQGELSNGFTKDIQKNIESGIKPSIEKRRLHTSNSDVNSQNGILNSKSTKTTHLNLAKGTENGQKSPFHIDEGMRNSLKNVLDKCKFVSKTKHEHGELSKEESTNNVSSIQHDCLEESTVNKHQESNNLEPSLKTKKIDCTESDLDDELLAGDDEEGIAMVIGSDNEDALLELSGDEVSYANNSSSIQEKVIDDLHTDNDIKKNDARSKVANAANAVEVIDITTDKLPDKKCLADSNGTNQSHKGNEKLNMNNEICQQAEENNVIKKNDVSECVSDGTDELNDTKPDVIEIHLTEEECVIETNKPLPTLDMKETSKSFDTTCDVQSMDCTDSKVCVSDDDDVIFEGESRPSPDGEPLKCVNDVSKINEMKQKEINELHTDSNNKDVKNGDVGVLKHDENKQIISKEAFVNANGELDEDNDVIVETEVKHTDVLSSHKDSEIKLNNELSQESNSNDEKATSSLLDRKRPALFENLQEHLCKRTKLENTETIGSKPNNSGCLNQNLGTHSEPVEVSDSDNEETGNDSELTKETAQESDVDMKMGNKLITMTEEELDKLVREKVKAYMLSQENTLVAKLTAKVKELQQNNDQWKRKVKDLQVKVNDVTVVQQKLEKRKAATAALRQITTRNVAVQVEDGKTAHGKPAKPSTSPQARLAPPATSPLGGPGTIRLPIPNSTLAKPVGSMAQSPQSTMINVSGNIDTPTVKTLLDTTRVQRTVGSVPLTTTTTTSQIINLVQYQPSLLPPRPPNPQGLVSIPTQTTMPAQQLSSPAGNPASKIIDLTDDDDCSKSRVVGTQGITTPPIVTQGIRQVLAAPGNQFVTPVGQPLSGYQFVVASSGGIRQTLAPGVTTTYVTNVGASQGLVSLQPSGPITPGTLMARAAAPASPNVTPLLRLASVPTHPAPSFQLPSVPTHPAPFPPLPSNQPTAGLKLLPPKPTLRISRGGQGIVLSWNMNLTPDYAVIACYQLFAYQETSAPPAPNLWKKVGEVKALALPMACTLTQFQVGNKYHFAVRAVDVSQRVGNFSDPGSIHLTAVVPASK